MAQVQKEPSLLQKDLLAERLAGSNSQVTDIPINLETKSRLEKLDRLELLSLLDIPLYKEVASILGKN